MIRSKIYRQKLIPPKGKIFIGSGDFEKIGTEHLDHFIKIGGLRPEHNVLDIGCGIGRMAIPLTGFLLDTSIYDGFDIVKQGIDWCVENIQNRYPNFRFHHVPLKNDLYLSDGGDAQKFTFPYHNSTYDFVILTSVFTHMQIKEVSQYLKEMYRVMNPGARAFVNFFIINEYSLKNMPAEFSFKHDHGEYFLMDDHVKSANVAFMENSIDEIILKQGFEIDKKHYGAWSKNPDAISFQDIYILRK